MISFKKLSLLFFTIIDLKLIQITNRLTRKLPKSANARCKSKVNNNIYRLYVHEFENTKLLNGKFFNFLNVQEAVGKWHYESRTLLWNYNLHYFDFLLSKECSQDFAIEKVKNKLIYDWISTPYKDKKVGYEPYPTSLRLVNWIKYLSRNKGFDQAILDSMVDQALSLENSLEYHLLGNHLFVNAKALVFVGATISNENSSRILKKGLSILDREIQEQILDDGANFELSPMYHQIMLVDILDLLSLADAVDIPDLNSRKEGWFLVVTKMLSWMGHMSHPDGKISFFNDAAFGIAPESNEIISYANKVGIQNYTETETETESLRYKNLKESGYITVSSPIYKAVLDVGRIGPKYIPGHAHADTLSFELSVDCLRVFVNSGTSEYGSEPERLRQRKTESHNTVQVAGLDSSEVWSGFRVARKALPSKPNINATSSHISVNCSHFGYKRLSSRTIHNRNWCFTDERLTIVDTLTNKFPEEGLAFYHLHPDIEVSVSGTAGELKLPSGRIIKIEATSQMQLQDTYWHPYFGVSIRTKKLVIPLVDSSLTFTIWF